MLFTSKRLRFTLAVPVLIALTCSASPACAVHSSNSGANDTLQHIARQMNQERNIRFILVQMMSDGLLREKESYDIFFNDTATRLNKNEIPEPYRSTYRELLRSFISGDKLYFSRAGTMPSMSEVLDPGSKFRKVENYDSLIAAEEFETQRSNAMIRQLIDDSIIQKGEKLRITYNKKEGLRVNGEKLLAPYDEKYTKMLLDAYPATQASTDGNLILSWITK